MTIDGLPVYQLQYVTVYIIKPELVKICMESWKEISEKPQLMKPPADSLFELDSIFGGHHKIKKRHSDRVILKKKKTGRFTRNQVSKYMDHDFSCMLLPRMLTSAMRKHP